MNLHNDSHLNDSQILQSLVAKEDLPAAVQEHLASCSRCIAARKYLQGNLTRLGELAVNSAPLLQKKIVIPRQQQAVPSQWLSGWRSIFALTATAGVVLLFIGLVSLKNTQEQAFTKLDEETLKDERLMAEISKLGRSGLPQSWLDISGELDVNIDEEMLEILTPSS